MFHTARPPKELFDEIVDPNDPKVFVLRVWDVETGKRVGPDLTAPRPDESQGLIRFAAAGRLVVATIQLFNGSNTVMHAVWDLDAGKLLDLPEPARAVYGGPDDPFVVTTPGTSGKNGRIAHLRDARTLAVVGRPFEVSELRTAAATPDGSRVVLGNSYWLGAWDPKTGERLHPRFWVYAGAKCLAIGADGSRFAAGYSESGLDVGFGQGGPGAAGLGRGHRRRRFAAHQDPRDVPRRPLRRRRPGAADRHRN